MMNMQRLTAVNSGVRRKLAAMVAEGKVNIENLRDDQRAALEEFYAAQSSTPREDGSQGHCEDVNHVPV